jgi:hypothetical protein
MQDVTLRDWVEEVAPLLGIPPTMLERIPVPEDGSMESNQTVFLPYGDRFWLAFDSAEAEIGVRLRLDQAVTIIQIVLADKPTGTGDACYRLFTPAGGVNVFPSREEFSTRLADSGPIPAAWEWEPEPGTEPRLKTGEAMVLEAERGRLLPRGIICGRFDPVVPADVVTNCGAPPNVERPSA